MGLIIGKIKGYSVCTITKGTLKKGEFFEEIEVKEPKIKEKALEIVENKGIIYGLKKDKKLKAIYLFDSKSEDDGKVLLFIDKILLDEISEEVEKEFEKALNQEMIELVSLEDYKRVEWGEDEIVPKKVKVGKYMVSLGSIFFMVGMVIGIIFDDFFIGMCLGIGLGGTSAMIVRKGKDDKKDNTK